MHMKFAFLVTVATISIVPSVTRAGIIAKTHTQDPATACTLSIPTTDTKVRPKALGFRNEGTVNAYIICGIDNFSNVDGFNWLSVMFLSFDGKRHTFDCTAVSHDVMYSSTQYLTETIEITDARFPGIIDVNVDDPDYDRDKYDLKHQGQSVTCLLPPGVSVISVAANQNDVDNAP